MRQFRISNELGTTVNLQGGTVFLWAPSGLGFANDLDYEETNGYFLKASKSISQIEKSGTLIFKPKNAYAEYQSLMNFLIKAKILTLEYKPYGTDWYSCDIDILEVSKGEISQTGVLEIPITFAPISPIYAKSTKNFEFPTAPAKGQHYTYTYGVSYIDSSQVGVLKIADSDIDAQMPCDFTLKITKPLTAPIFTAKNLETGNIIGRIDLSAVSVESSQTLIFTTKPTKAGVVIVNSDASTADITPQLGLSKGVPTFFQLPPNTKLEFKCFAESLENLEVNLEVYKYYRTV